MKVTIKMCFNPSWAHLCWLVKESANYRSGTVNSNTVNSKFHLIRSFFEIFARFLSFHVENAWLIQIWLIRSSTNSK